MNIIEELKTQYDEAEALWKNYEQKLQAFRSAVKNDVTSLEAGARKVTEAVQRMNRAYGDVIARLSSEEMTQAITNAERLAAAMETLATLKSHHLTVATENQRGRTPR